MMNPVSAIKGARAFWTIVKHPDRLDEVFSLVDSVASPEEDAALLKYYRRNAQAAASLESRPRLGSLDLDALLALPEDTLGHEYAAFMRKRGLDPAALPVRPADNPNDFVLAHSLETHDLWHVVTGFDTDVAGELGLQAFYMNQIPAKGPLAILLAGLIGTFLFHFHEREARMTQIARGWMLGRRARLLFGTDWNSLWTQPLATVRASFNIDPGGVAALDGGAAVESRALAA